MCGRSAGGPAASVRVARQPRPTAQRSEHLVKSRAGRAVEPGQQFLVERPRRRHAPAEEFTSPVGEAENLAAPVVHLASA